MREKRTRSRKRAELQREPPHGDRKFCLALDREFLALLFTHPQRAPRISYYDFIEIEKFKKPRNREPEKSFFLRTTETIDNLHKTRLFFHVFLPIFIIKMIQFTVC